MRAPLKLAGKDTDLIVMAKRSIVAAAVTFGVAAITAYQGSTQLWQGLVFVYNPSTMRQPAAINQALDFSNLKGHDLKLASHERLVAEASIITETQRIGIELGHFVLRNSDGGKSFACDVFDQVRMKFLSEDISVHGNPVEMTVTSPCLATRSYDRIETIWIPTAMLSSASQTRPFYLSSDDTQITLKNYGDSFPRQWFLQHVELLAEDSAAPALEINSAEIRQIRKLKPLQLIW